MNFAEFARTKGAKDKKKRGYWGRVGHDAKVGAGLGLLTGLAGAYSIARKPQILADLAKKHNNTGIMARRLTKSPHPPTSMATAGLISGGLLGSQVGALRGTFADRRNLTADQAKTVTRAREGALVGTLVPGVGTVGGSMVGAGLQSYRNRDKRK